MVESIEHQFGEENVFMKKYLALRNKCEHLQQGNEKLINRLQHVKKLIRKYNREKKFLQARLDNYKDNYREAQVPVMWEQDQMYNILKPNVSPGTADENSTQDATSKPKSGKKIKALLKSPDQSLTNQPASGNVMSSPVARDIFSIGLGSYDTPRRPTNAFLMFCDQYRQSVKNDYLREKNAIIAQQELTKRLALKWGSLSHEDKKIYQDMFDIQRREDESLITNNPADSIQKLEDEATNQHVNAMYMESDAAVSSLLTDENLT